MKTKKYFVNIKTGELFTNKDFYNWLYKTKQDICWDITGECSMKYVIMTVKNGKALYREANNYGL